MSMCVILIQATQLQIEKANGKNISFKKLDSNSSGSKVWTLFCLYLCDDRYMRHIDENSRAIPREMHIYT
jgi:hypothetical protein